MKFQRNSKNEVKFAKTIVYLRSNRYFIGTLIWFTLLFTGILTVYVY
jgi:hypothetical protein